MPYIMQYDPRTDDAVEVWVDGPTQEPEPQIDETEWLCSELAGSAEGRQKMIAALAVYPIADALEAVKEWLAGKGFGVFFAESFDAKTCMPGCLASAPLHGCKLGLHDRRDTMSPGPKCPAMIARGEENKP